MADISFDDLIPQNGAGASSGGGSVSFDDLIPKQPNKGRHISFEEGRALLEQEAQAGAGGATGAALTSFVDGLPVIGPYLTGGVQRASAGIASTINGKGYDENLKAAQDVTQAAQDAHPYVTTAGNVAGGVAGTLQLVAAAPAAFGAGSAPLAARMLASGISGSMLGGTDAAVRSGGDIKSIEDGALWGFGAGFAGPAAGRLIGSGAQTLADAVRNRSVAKAAGTTGYALEKIGKAAAADGLDAAAMRARLQELGPNAMIGDLGPNLRGQVAALANMPGEGQQTVRAALEARQAGANARIASVVDSTMGRSVVPSALEGDIAAGQRAISPLYEDAFRNARAVDTTPIAHALESDAVNLRGEGQRAAQRIRSMLDIAGTDVLDPNPQTLFQTRQALDGMMATEANPQALRVMSAARQRIDDELSRAVPDIKQADAAYAELARQREALQRGQTVFSSGREAPRPAELAQEVTNGALPQGLQIGPSAVPFRMSQGARAEVDRIVGNNANDIAALNRLIKSEGDWNRSRLTSLFGPDKADRLMKALENELVYADTRNFAIGNSATAGRQQAIKDLGGGSGDGFSLRDAYAAGGPRAVLRGATVKAADRAFSGLTGARTARNNASLAKSITDNREALLAAIQSRTPRTSSPELERVIQAVLLSGAAARAR